MSSPIFPDRGDAAHVSAVLSSPQRVPSICRALTRAVVVTAVLFTAALLTGCSTLVQREAQQQLTAGQTEQALNTLEAGLRRYPESAELRTLYLRTREVTLQRWIDEAQRQRAAGQSLEAERLLARAQALDPSNARVAELALALRTQRRMTAALQEAQDLLKRGQPAAALRVADEALKADPRHEGLLTFKRELHAGQRALQLRAAQAGLAEQRPISLDFRDAGLRQVLDLVTRHSGLNFVLDKDIRSDLRVTIYLKQVRVEEALDLIVSTHQIARKVLDERTVLLYPNTPEKQREYQEQVIRVFYLASAEAKGAAAFLKSMLKLKEPFIEERSNMLALRESPETVLLAERLIGLYDTQEPEVLLELEVLEIRSTRLTELGIKVPNTVSLTPLAPDGGGLTIANLRGLGEDRIGVSIGGVTLNLRRDVGDFEILANPRVRARNRQNAKVLIGDKVPIITTTTGVGGFVGDSVSYIDVGLKLDIEPTIYANDEVAIKLALEVGSLAGQIRTASGTVAYQISTRNASTALRLKDGETQLLAGLLSREDRTNASRIPLIGDVPVLGRLFSSQLDDGTRTELVLAITPRIVRNLRQPEPSEAELWVGTEAYTRLRQVGGRAAVDPPPAAESSPATDKSVGPDPATSGDVEAPTSPAQSGPVPITLRWSPESVPQADQPFTLVVNGDLVDGLRGMTLEMQASPRGLRLIEVKSGDVWLQGDVNVSVSSAADVESGVITAGVLRSEATAAKGSGRLFELLVVAPKAGRIELNMLRASPIDLRGAAQTIATPAPLVLEVGP